MLCLLGWEKMLVQIILFYTKIFMYFYIKPKSLGAKLCSAGGCVFDMPNLQGTLEEQSTKKMWTKECSDTRMCKIVYLELVTCPLC
jgi:hypothetical protein